MIWAPLGHNFNNFGYKYKNDFTNLCFHSCLSKLIPRILAYGTVPSLVLSSLTVPVYTATIECKINTQLNKYMNKSNKIINERTKSVIN